MTRLGSYVFVALFSFGSVAFAADQKADPSKPAAAPSAPKKVEGKGEAKPGAKPEGAAAAKAGDPTGTWSWTFNSPNGGSMERTIKLAREGEKLTGSSSGRNGDTPIEEGKFKDGVVSFKVVRERDGQKFSSTFQGKVEGDLIKGTMTSNRGGEERTNPWEAKRVKQ